MRVRNPIPAPPSAMASRHATAIPRQKRSRRGDHHDLRSHPTDLKPDGLFLVKVGGHFPPLDQGRTVALVVKGCGAAG